MLWACLHFSTLPLSAVFGELAASSQPCALYEGPRQRPLIFQANAAALAQGAKPGLTVAAARALCAKLDLRRREPDAERHGLQLLATWAYHYSAQVSLAEPDSLYLEVGASLTLFKGWPQLCSRLQQELQLLGYAGHRLGVAPVAAAARVLALNHDRIALRRLPMMLQALDPIPLHSCGLPATAAAQLQGMGFRRLGELWRLPRQELARRIGPENLLWLDQLRGIAAEMLPLYQPPDSFGRRIELDGLIESWQALLFPLRRLVRELGLFLQVRDSGVQTFELRLEHEDHATTRVPVNLSSVQREADALYEFCRGRLERVAIPAPVSAIALVAAGLAPFRPGHRDLFEPARCQGLDWPDLTERLRSRLGDEALRGLACVADHRPERAWRFTAVDTATTKPAATRSPSATKSTAKTRNTQDSKPVWPGAKRSSAETHAAAARLRSAQVPNAARPLWLLARPIPLRQPLAQILAGPERIETGWWDGDDARRDYYIVRCANGQRAWAYLPAGEDSGWMLHGWFA
ncbi:Y-family DNA polymerase [Tahibacter harae]|uniref:Y-family DNA polymerase n=1 Tax=Tahibacter harae TaxID=2963937 RepID=UPI0031BAEBF2